PHHCPEIDVEQPLEIPFADLLEGAGERNARIVEQQIDTPVLGHDSLWQRGDRCAIRDVELMAGDADPEPAKELRSFRQPRLADICKREMAASPRERLRDRTSDAAAGARDHGGAIMKRHSLWHGLPV